MIKYLLKTTEEYRLANVEDVKEFHKELREDAENQGYELSSYGYSHKDVKVKGEVVDSYEIVKAVKIFSDQKDPVYYLDNLITYDGVKKDDADEEN